MSNELKMGDLFRGKVVVDSSSGKVGGGCNEIGDDDGWIAHFGYSGEFTAQDSHEMATYAAHAINSHDALTEHNRLLNLECDQLKADKAELVEGLKEALVWMEDHVSMPPVAHIHDLLNKHKGE